MISRAKHRGLEEISFVPAMDKKVRKRRVVWKGYTDIVFFQCQVKFCSEQIIFGDKIPNK